METVWDLYFCNCGVAEVATYGRASGIRYHVFDSYEAAFGFACRSRGREWVIQRRAWSADNLDSPFITDHREARNG